MPTYEYKCDSCGQVFEVRQRFDDTPLVEHEGCGGAVRRLLSAPALQFKGSGWYVNDYARAGSKSSSDGGEKPAGEKPAKEKSDSKPADSSAGSTTSTPSTAPSSSSTSDKQ